NSTFGDGACPSIRTSGRYSMRRSLQYRAEVRSPRSEVRGPRFEIRGPMATRTLAATLLVVLAQQQQPATPPTTVPPPPQPKPAGPVATTTLTAHADQYAGATVSLTAAVAQVYGTTAFSVAQASQKDRADVLVVAPILTAPVQPGSYVTIIGDVIRFDTATLATRLKDAAPSLAPDVVERYRGKPA